MKKVLTYIIVILRIFVVYYRLNGLAEFNGIYQKTFYWGKNERGV